MASLSELVDYAHARQPRNGLAEMAAHFVEGASSGYDAGHAEALKLRDNPTTVNPETGKEVSLDAYIKLLDVKNKLLENENQTFLSGAIRDEVNTKDTQNRDASMADMATNALNAQGRMAGEGGTTIAGKVAGAVANPDSAGIPRKPTKTSIEMVDGKVKYKREFGDPKSATLQQLAAIKSYVDSNGSPESMAAMAVVYPKGPDEFASKIITQQMEFKSKKATIDDAKNQARQDRLEAAYRTAQTSVRGDASIARTEVQRDAAITAYNRIKEVKDSGETLNPIDYVDVLGQIYKARTGAAPTNEVLQTARQETAKGQTGKWYTYFTGKQAPATSADIQDSLMGMAASMGTQSDKIHSGYMKSRLKPPSGLDPDRIANVDAGRGLSFQEATGYQPQVKGTGNKIKVSNGKETLLIDPADAAAAAKDGYKTL